MQASLHTLNGCGEISCLDPLTGEVLWHNPLEGFGTGLATVATEQRARSRIRQVAVLAEAQCRAQTLATPVTT